MSKTAAHSPSDLEARLPSFLTAQNDFPRKEVVLINLSNSREARIPASEYGRIRTLLHSLFGEEDQLGATGHEATPSETEQEHPGSDVRLESASDQERTSSEASASHSGSQSTPAKRGPGRKPAPQPPQNTADEVPPTAARAATKSKAPQKVMQRDGFAIHSTSGDNELESYDVKVGDEIVARIQQDESSQFNLIPQDSRYKKSRHRNFMGVVAVLDVRHRVTG